MNSTRRGSGGRAREWSLIWLPWASRLTPHIRFFLACSRPRLHSLNDLPAKNVLPPALLVEIAHTSVRCGDDKYALAGAWKLFSDLKYRRLEFPSHLCLELTALDVAKCKDIQDSRFFTFGFSRSLN